MKLSWLGSTGRAVRALVATAVIALPALAVATGVQAQTYRSDDGPWSSWDDRAAGEDRYVRDGDYDRYDRYDRSVGRYDERYDRPVRRDDVWDDEGEAFGALDAYGAWVDHREWGTVWRPNVSRGWRPYTVGRWVNTDEYGWYWESDEPFGWAVFHYGRWVWDEREGWLWLPGTEWGPAWVAWSYSDDWVGWAPLPPDAIWEEDRGLILRASFYEPRFAPWWVFVSPRHMLYPNVYRHVAPWRRSVEVMRIVRPATHYRWSGRRVYNSGIGVREVERMTRTRIAPVRVMAARRPEIGSRRRGDSVAVFSPRIAPSARWQAGRGGSWQQFDGGRRRASAPAGVTPQPRQMAPSRSVPAGVERDGGDRRRSGFARREVSPPTQQPQPPLRQPQARQAPQAPAGAGEASAPRPVRQPPHTFTRREAPAGQVQPQHQPQQQRAQRSFQPRQGAAQQAAGSPAPVQAPQQRDGRGGRRHDKAGQPQPDGEPQGGRGRRGG